MKEEYNSRPTLGQFIVIILAVIAVIRFLFDLQGCSSYRHGVYGGVGTQIYAGEEWKREDGETYGKIGYRGEMPLHVDHGVFGYVDVHHKSHPGARDRGEENAEGGIYINFP